MYWSPSKLRPTCDHPTGPRSRWDIRSRFTHASVGSFGVTPAASENSKRPIRRLWAGSPNRFLRRTYPCFGEDHRGVARSRVRRIVRRSASKLPLRPGSDGVIRQAEQHWCFEFEFPVELLSLLAEGDLQQVSRVDVVVIVRLSGEPVPVLQSGPEAARYVHRSDLDRVRICGLGPSGTCPKDDRKEISGSYVVRQLESVALGTVVPSPQFYSSGPGNCDRSCQVAQDWNPAATLPRRPGSREISFVAQRHHGVH